jgi:hypothetical protein
MPVSNTFASRKLGTRTVTVMNVINVFAQIVVAASCPCGRRISTPCYPHSLNTFQVSVYQNYTVATNPVVLP